MATTLTLEYYFKRVQRESGLTVSTSFPTSLSDEDQLVIDCINSTLRELNNKYYLAFKQTEYILTPSVGVASYDLRNAPYTQTFYRINRLARNGITRVSDSLPLDFLDYTEIDWLQPPLTGSTDPSFYSAYGESFILFPAPGQANQLRIRYYGLHIGQGNTGIKKRALFAATDTTMLEDEWEDALTYGATYKVRSQQVMDAKTQAYKERWEYWERILIDMSQPGEDSPPQFLLPGYSYTDIGRKVGNFFNTNL